MAERRIEIGDGVWRFLDSQKPSAGPAVDGHGDAAEKQSYPITKVLPNRLNQITRRGRARRQERLRGNSIAMTSARARTPWRSRAVPRAGEAFNALQFCMKP